VTTVTPSDQAGADSARRSATIPTQRSSRNLRLLVLGTGPEAAAFKARAAESGAELAQRFSVRVTHVVVDDGISEEDARVARARAADVPVLGLAAGAELFDVELDDDASDAVQERDGGAEVGGGEVEAEVDVPPVEAARNEAAQADRGEIRPSDVFTGSALEAALLFPPLSVDEGSTAPTSALMEAVSAISTETTCGCGDETRTVETDEVDGATCGFGIDADADADADDDSYAFASSADDEDARDGGEGEGEIAVVDDGPVVEAPDASAVGVATVARASGGAAAASIAWALVPLVSLGLLTPVAMGYAAYRLRSRSLAVATALYSGAVAAAFTVSAAAPLRTGAHAAVGDLLTGCLTASWLGGTVHAFLIRRRVFH
jgi:hypothetical protein